MRGVPAGAAGGVQRDACRQGIEDLADDGLLDVDELVRGGVVARGPAAVAVVDADQWCGDAGAEAFGALEKSAHLGQAGVGESFVVLSGKGLQQRDALQADEVGQRVLVDA